jgi:hypothetical protein
MGAANDMRRLTVTAAAIRITSTTASATSQGTAGRSRVKVDGRVLSTVAGLGRSRTIASRSA